MKKLKPTHLYLGLTADEYETKRFEQYQRWCKNLAIAYRVSLQCLLANRAIANYYSDQFLELEHSFIIVAQRLDGVVNQAVLIENYNSIMMQIYKTYPKPLIAAAKKMRIENPNFNQN